MKKIIVIGSSNVDMVVRTSHLPAPGETILGGEFFMNQGGKGANQAVAIKRLGGNLIFMAKLGNDVLGRQSVGYFKKEGIDTRYIALDEDSASGVALISVDDHAENSIVVASGANMLLNEQDVDKMLEEMCEGDPLDAIGNSASNSGVCCQKGFRERSEGGAESGSCPQSSQRIVPASVHGHSEPHRGGDAYGHKDCQ